METGEVKKSVTENSGLNKGASIESIERPGWHSSMD